MVFIILTLNWTLYCSVPQFVCLFVCLFPQLNCFGICGKSNCCVIMIWKCGGGSHTVCMNINLLCWCSYSLNSAMYSFIQLFGLVYTFWVTVLTLESVYLFLQICLLGLWLWLYGIYRWFEGILTCPICQYSTRYHRPMLSSFFIFNKCFLVFCE